MNKRPLIDKALNNWPIKFVCVILAVFLYIFHQASLIERKTFVVPLTVVENGIVMHVGTVQPSVSVVVKSSKKDINSIHNTDIKAFVSLDNITEKGKYKLPVVLNVENQLLAFDPLEILLKDETVTIDVDRKAFKYVSLEPSVVGEIAHGYKISEISVNPSTVEIYGPETVLNAIDKLSTTKINVSNAETTFTTEAYYVETTSIIDVGNKGPYRATVIVSPIDHEMVFSNIKLMPVNLKNGLEITSDLPLINVKLAGSMKGLEDFVAPENFVQINCENIDAAGEYELTVKFNVPSAYDLVEKSAETVTITVENTIEEPVDETETEENSFSGESVEV